MTEAQTQEQVSGEQEERTQDDTQVTTEDHGHPNKDTFDREYVEKLRKEAADHRTKLRKLEEAEEKRNKEALSETERLKAEKEEAETKANETLSKANQRAIRAEARVAPWRQVPRPSG